EDRGACRDRRPRALVAVQDQGIGIPPDAQQRIFQRFYRAPNADAERISGLGIGLYVVRELVELHGGRITVASSEGEGSTFTIFLPLAEPHESGADSDSAPITARLSP
ncbi:ATP-binding protein, partial [Candidatus Gracilibacteria bacterium]|nr:ATP-binding protein [Candidatus Gracilibacteria bacterium]